MECLQKKQVEAVQGFALLPAESGGQALRVSYELVPAAGQRRGALVLLHGSAPGGSSKANFSASVAAYADDFDLIFIDLPGWGRSDSAVVPGSRSHFNAAAVNVVLDALNIHEPVNVMGCSMGAHSACAFALEHAERVQSLILVSGGSGRMTPAGAPPPVGIQALQKFYREPTREHMQAMVEAIFQDRRLVTEAGVSARFESAMSRPAHLKSFVESITLNASPYPDVIAETARIQCPVLLIWGREDRFVPPSIGQALFESIPRAELHVFGQCGHAPLAECTERFNELTRGFLLAHGAVAGN